MAEVPIEARLPSGGVKATTSRLKAGFFFFPRPEYTHRMDLYDACRICPRDCGTNRNAGERGLCGETAELRVAWAGLHFGEEPPVTGATGSGTVFFTGCNLRCAFCQNYQISQDGMGRALSTEELARVFLELEAAGAENVNLVTGSHAVPAIALALRRARELGLSVPALWNSSAYESPGTLALLDGLVTVWLPDLKTLNPNVARAAFKAEDYPAAAKRAIRSMVERSPLEIERPDDERYPSGRIVSGVIVRHLALPGRLADTEAVLRWFQDHLAGKALLSLMTQYTPVAASPHARELTAFENRPISVDEYGRLTELIEELGVDAGFYQELVEGTDWLPDFSLRQPFSSALARPLWHWADEGR